MFAPSGEYSESRPFKIFISLLDKWEIGSALTDVLVLDALKAILSLMQRSADENNEDVRLILGVSMIRVTYLFYSPLRFP